MPCFGGRPETNPGFCRGSQQMMGFRVGGGHGGHGVAAVAVV